MKRITALLLVVALMLTVLPLEGFGQEPVQVANFGELKNAIANAPFQDGKSSLILKLTGTEYLVDETLLIPEGLALEIHKSEGVVSTFKRNPTSNDITMFNIQGKGASLTLDGGNNQIVFDGQGTDQVLADESGSFITVSKGGILNISGTIFENESIVGGLRIAPIYGTDDSTYITLNSGKIRNNTFSEATEFAAGGFYITKGANLIIEGGEISGNKVSLDGNTANKYSAGAIIIDDRAVGRIDDIAIKDNFSSVGGIIVGNLNLDDYNHTTDKKTDLVDLKQSSLTMFDGSITGNKAAHHGGVLVFVNGEFTLSDGEIRNNGPLNEKVQVLGGGVATDDYYNYVRETGAIVEAKVKLADWYKPLFTMTGGTITENTAYQGGGLYLDGQAFTLEDGKIYKNTAYQGGGIYLDGQTLTMNYGEIHDNTADQGGGVYIYGQTFIMKDGNIYNNTADQGGGLYLNNPITQLIKGKIYNNKANDQGGGIYLAESSGEPYKLEITNGAVYWNTAKEAGGVYHIPTKDSQFLSVFADIDKTKYGGYIVANKALDTTSKNVDFKNIAGPDGKEITLAVAGPEGGEITWTDEAGQIVKVVDLKPGESYILTSEMPKEDFDEAIDISSFLIFDNNADLGGGIASYGSVFFLSNLTTDNEDKQGTEPQKKIVLEVAKKWATQRTENPEVEMKIWSSLIRNREDPLESFTIQKATRINLTDIGADINADAFAKSLILEEVGQEESTFIQREIAQTAQEKDGDTDVYTYNLTGINYLPILDLDIEKKWERVAQQEVKISVYAQFNEGGVDIPKTKLGEVTLNKDNEFKANLKDFVVLKKDDALGLEKANLDKFRRELAKGTDINKLIHLEELTDGNFHFEAGKLTKTDSNLEIIEVPKADGSGTEKVDYEVYAHYKVEVKNTKEKATTTTTSTEDRTRVTSGTATPTKTTSSTAGKGGPTTFDPGIAKYVVILGLAGLGLVYFIRKKAQ